MNYSSLPAVPEVRFPSWEAFHLNPISFFESLRAIGREFGAVKIIPPADWDPPFALDALTKDQALFHVRTQEVHSLMTGKVSALSLDRSVSLPSRLLLLWI